MNLPSNLFLLISTSSLRILKAVIQLLMTCGVWIYAVVFRDRATVTVVRVLQSQIASILAFQSVPREFFSHVIRHFLTVYAFINFTTFARRLPLESVATNALLFFRNRNILILSSTVLTVHYNDRSL